MLDNIRDFFDEQLATYKISRERFVIAMTLMATAIPLIHFGFDDKKTRAMVALGLYAPYMWYLFSNYLLGKNADNEN